MSIALGGTGFFTAFTKAMRERKKLLNSLPKETTESILDGEKTLREELSGYTLVFAVLAAPAFIYTLLGSTLVAIFEIQTDAQARMVIGALLLLGISSFFTNVGRSGIYGEAMKGLNEKEGGSKGDFGRYTIFLVFFETLAIYGLLVFQLGLIFSGVMHGETSITMENANIYFTGAMILGLSSSCSILMVTLYKKLEEPLNEDVQLFGKKIIYLSLGHIPLVIGLVIAIYLMVSSGLVG